MKKILFILTAIFALSISAYAANVSVTLTTGQTIEGKLVSYNDTLLIMVPSFYQTKQQVEVTPERVHHFKISGVGSFFVQDGKFVPSEKTTAKLEKKQINQESLNAANPNEVISKAFKSTGGVCVGVGIPSLFVGTILVAYGNTGLVDAPKTQADIDKNASKGKCASAGYVLMPMGAALTIVGIPLHVHGKRIGELNVNYTGNGAGVSFNF